MIEEKYIPLLERLVDGTGDGRVDWQPDRDKEQTFFAEFGKAYVQIQARIDPDYPDQPDYVVQLLSRDGAVMEEFSNATLRKVERQEGKGYALMARLYTDAKRNAFKVEQVVDDILKDLES